VKVQKKQKTLFGKRASSNSLIFSFLYFQIFIQETVQTNPLSKKGKKTHHYPALAGCEGKVIKPIGASLIFHSNYLFLSLPKTYVNPALFNR